MTIQQIIDMTDSTKVYLRAARLVSNKDGSFGIGTPINAVTLDRSSSLYDFDGYMNNEKIQVCYVAVDSLGKQVESSNLSRQGDLYKMDIDIRIHKKENPMDLIPKLTSLEDVSLESLE